MLPQSKGKIFLGDERGHYETDTYRSYRTFNFGCYQNKHKNAVSSLYALNEDTLAAGKSNTFTVETNSSIVIIPLVGGLTCSYGTDNLNAIYPGQSLLIDVAAGVSVSISNPYDDDLINYLYLWIKKPEQGLPNNITGKVFEFDIEKHKNQLEVLFDNNKNATVAKGYIGQLGSRSEVFCQLSKPGNIFFIYVIDGEFEVQYRLLHARDGLALWDVDQVEIEALSSNSIIIVLELPADI